MISMATEPAVVGEAVIFRKDKENGLYTGMIASCGAIIPCPAEKSIKNPKRIPGKAACQNGLAGGRSRRYNGER